jgi:Uma2 family endonuclease
MSAEPIKMYSQEEYLELERAAEYKSEYYRGEIFAMSGAGLNHNCIVDNITITVGGFLRGKACRTFSRDLRIHIPENTLYTYPDLMILCGQPDLLDEHMDTLLNPSVIVEVLSPSTRKYDKGRKFQLYKGIPSLMEYVLIDSEKIAAEVYSKEEGGLWALTSESDDINGSIELSHIHFTLKMSDIYLDTIKLN